ncbi:MAG: nuclear transport factor 2 family protein [Acidimicrobiia bacterium]
MSAADDVLEANRTFYAAFEARDLKAMAEVWECSDRATVTHPGRPTLRSWPAVAESWRRIFEHTPYIQFFLTDEAVVVAGDAAWVTLYENILQEVPGRRGGPGEGSGPSDAVLGDARIAATNVFVRDEGSWRMVVHHGSPVAG